MQQSGVITINSPLLLGMKRHLISSFVSGIILAIGIVALIGWWSAPMPGPITTTIMEFPKNNLVYHSTFNPHAIAPKVTMSEFEKHAIGRTVTISIWEGWIDAIMKQRKTPEFGEYRDSVWYVVEHDGIAIAAEQPIIAHESPFTYRHEVRFDPAGRVFVSEIRWAVITGFLISLILIFIGIGGFYAVRHGKDKDWSIL